MWLYCYALLTVRVYFLKNQGGCLHHYFLVDIVFEVLGNAIKQEKYDI